MVSLRKKNFAGVERSPPITFRRLKCKEFDYLTTSAFLPTEVLYKKETSLLAWLRFYQQT